jgi:ubiquitin carboxyl-terminal hydrolase 14
MLVRSAFPQFAEQRGGVYQQQDADEFYIALLTQLRKLPSLPGGPQAPNAIDQLFVGKMKVKHTCTEADEVPTETEERFEKLSCHIRGGAGAAAKEATNHLLEGVAAGLDEEVEKNSTSLGRVARFRKSQRISSLPYILAVQFVRFFWRKDIKQKTKIVRPVEFPFTLDLYPYCTPELQTSLNPQRDSGKEIAPLENRTAMYELCAVVSHQGRSADGGHYVAWVRAGGEDDWLEYNDDKVTPRRKQDIAALSGKGGGDWHIAYICLYRTRGI